VAAADGGRSAKLVGMAKFVVLVAFVVGGIALVVLAIRLALHARTLARAPGTTGKVVRLVRREGMAGDDGPTFAPEVAFEWQGRPHMFISVYGSSPPTSHVGETVRVAVPHGDPANADLARDRTAFAMPIIVALLGVGVVLVPLVVWWVDTGRPGVPPGAGMLIFLGLFLLAGASFVGALAPDPAGFHEFDGHVHEVLELDPRTDSITRALTPHLVTVKFNAPDGAEIEAAGSLPKDGRTVSSGMLVRVFYDPARPGSARLQPPKRVANPRFIKIAGWLAVAGGVAMLF
jgi:hypothetical protein